MKTVFKSNSELAHGFATGATTGRASNMFIHNAPNGPEIYSYGYHFCIAKLLDNNAALVTSRGYSNSTAKHINITRQAISHKRLIYCPYPNNTKDANLEYWQRAAASLNTSINKSPKVGNIDELIKIKNLVERFCSFFNIDIPENINQCFEVLQSEKVVKKLASLEAQRANRVQNEAKRNKLKRFIELRKFARFEASRLYVSGPFDYLRINPDSKQIETTQGVKIELNEALRFYNRLKQGLSVGEKISQYQVNQVGEVVKIGCHNITAKHLQKIGQRLETLANN